MTPRIQSASDRGGGSLFGVHRYGAHGWYAELRTFGAPSRVVGVWGPCAGVGPALRAAWWTARWLALRPGPVRATLEAAGWVLELGAFED